jgi:hypothetical protein
MTIVTSAIDDQLARWIAAQRSFFVATAALARDGRVYVEPKDGTVAVLGRNRVAYLDRSGGETIAHVRENGRIAVMLFALDGPRRVVHLHGSARVVVAGGVDFDALVTESGFCGARRRSAVVLVAVDDVSDAANRV